MLDIDTQTNNAFLYIKQTLLLIRICSDPMKKMARKCQLQTKNRVIHTSVIEVRFGAINLKKK